MTPPLTPEQRALACQHAWRRAYAEDRPVPFIAAAIRYAMNDAYEEAANRVEFTGYAGLIRELKL